MENHTVYQVMAEEKKTVVRVASGRIGFIKQFDNPKDPLINRIIKFCKSQSYVKLVNGVEPDQFFE
ncbi:hypothetical protein MUO71_04900 [Candidatus Bathyarchaeota archaeon]|nr:hypothetical protein [Candidatus Bathyarchaeota archaeon]